MAAELLSILLQRIYISEQVPRFSQPTNAPHIHHLAYADDVVIFSTGKRHAIRTVMKALRDYELVSGQLISTAKSSFYMHPKASVEDVDQIKRYTQCRYASFPFTYLGCPIYHGRKRIQYFATLVQKIKSRCQGWQGRLLSAGGRAVLVKSVLQALPTYLFSALQPPKAVVKDIQRYFSNFFWGQVEGNNRYHWSSWGTLARPVEQGGVGFTSLSELIFASAAKLWWSFRTQNTLWSRFMRAKYCSRVHPVAKLWQSGDSHVWRRMVEVREEVEKHLGWRLLTGDVNFWWDNWAGMGALARQVPLLNARYLKIPLKNFLNGQELDTGALGEFFQEPLLSDLQGDFSLWGRGDSDLAVWRLESHGGFTYRSAKKLWRGSPEKSIIYSKCWHKHLPFKMSFLLWRVLHRKIPTDDVMMRFGYSMASRCSCCRHPGMSTLRHIFLDGATAMAVWRFFAGSFGMRIQFRGLNDLLWQWWQLRAKNKLQGFILRRLPVIICWELWVHYTCCRYGSDVPNITRIIFKISKDIAECVCRKWPGWDPFLPNWRFIVEKMDSFVTRRRPKTVVWQKPTVGFKVNLAFGYFDDDADTGYAAIVRDSEGKFCFASASGSSVSDSFQGLAFVLCSVMERCVVQSLGSLVVETDFQPLIDCFSDGRWSHHGCQHIVSRLRFLASFISVTAQRCSPLVNEAAVSLARWIGIRRILLPFLVFADLPPRTRALLLLDDVPHVF